MQWDSHFMSVQSLRSCPTLCRLPGSSVHGILQPRIQEWAMPSSRGSSWPRDWTHISVSPALWQILYCSAAGCHLTNGSCCCFCCLGNGGKNDGHRTDKGQESENESFAYENIPNTGKLEWQCYFILNTQAEDFSLFLSNWFLQFRPRECCFKGELGLLASPFFSRRPRNLYQQDAHGCPGWKFYQRKSSSTELVWLILLMNTAPTDYSHCCDCGYRLHY